MDVVADSALAPFEPGRLIRIARGALTVDIAPAAGGRIEQIHCAGIDWLQGHDARHAGMIAWGCYPMLPWAGRLRHGRFSSDGEEYRLPLNLGAHAIHGVGFALPWQVERHMASCVELSLHLPHDERWPFGGSAHQRIEIGDSHLRLELSVTAGARPMPAELGWHPWLRKPVTVEFAPTRAYPRDGEGIATLPLVDPPPPPWDDCFIFPAESRIVLRRHGRTLRLSSDCDHWVVYDAPARTTCVEPQSGPPDAFNLRPRLLQPGETLARWFLWDWGA